MKWNYKVDWAFQKQGASFEVPIARTMAYRCLSWTPAFMANPTRPVGNSIEKAFLEKLSAWGCLSFP